MDPIELDVSDAAKRQKVTELVSRLRLSQDDVQNLCRVFSDELEKGLDKGLAGSSLQMENTHVPELTDGREEGLFLALDLGGTNFRVILLELQAGRIVKEEVAYYSVQEAIRLGPGRDLFDFLADCVHDFVGKQGLEKGGRLALGFTFSFPMEQLALNSALLVNWTKSFNCSGVIGTDAAGQLNEALRRKRQDDQLFEIEVVAILNDATGTLVKGAYDDKDTCIGLILGTGCNGAYLEKAERVKRWGSAEKQASGHVIVDPEFGAFGDNGCVDFIRSEFDERLDKESLLPGSFTYEKYFSGKYIGELARLILVRLSEEKLAFVQAEKSCRLFVADSFSAKDLSDVTWDVAESKSGRVRALLKKLSLPADDDATEDDVAIVKYVCSLLAQRCAMLVAVALGVFLGRTDEDGRPKRIAVTGSLYKGPAGIRENLEKYTRLCSGGRADSSTFLSDDGSGKGAGLVAAIARRIGEA